MRVHALRARVGHSWAGCLSCGAVPTCLRVARMCPLIPTAACSSAGTGALQEVVMEVMDRWHKWPAWAKLFLQR